MNYDNGTRWVQVEEIECSRGAYGTWVEDSSETLGIYEISESYLTISDDELIDILTQYGLLPIGAELSVEFTGYFAEINDAHNRKPLYRVWAVPEEELDWRITKGIAVYDLNGGVGLK